MMYVLDYLKQLDFCHLSEVPRREERRGTDTSHFSTMGASLFVALVSAHANGETIAVGWMHTVKGGPVEILVGGGSSLIPSTDDQQEELRLLYPPGSRGTHLQWEDLERRLFKLPTWLRCDGALDVFATIEKESPIGIARGRFEEYVAHLTQTSFAWLVIANPIPAGQLKSSMEKLALELPYLENYGKNEAKKLTFERARAHYREMAQSESAGMWNIHILVGGEQSSVSGVAALLCNASDISQLPYMLRPGQKIDLSKDTISINQTTEKNFDRPEIASPFDGSTELLCAIARPPVTELPGVRLVTPHTFDVTAEKQDSSKQSLSVSIGTVRDVGLESAGLFSITSDTLVRHTFVCGTTGSGKSQTVRKLLQELTRQKLPWLVIEPAKAEYAGMAGRLGNADVVFVIRPGELDAIPASLNPLEPENGFPLQTHIDLVRALFLAAFEAEEPFPQVLSQALTRCYQELGWDLTLSAPKSTITPRYPDLGDLQHTAREVIGNIGYSDKIRDDVRGFVDVRIGSLRLGTPGRFFAGGHPLQVAELLKRNVVIEIEDVGNDQDKAFLIGVVLIRIYEHLRVKEREERKLHKNMPPPPLRHITVIEEAHRLLKNVTERGPTAHAVELFAGLLAEIRAYGEGLVVAEQIPNKILPDVIKNTALKVMHRLPAQDDRDHVGATMNLSIEQSQYVVSLKPGWAAVFTDGMDHPLLALIDGKDEVLESDALAKRVYASSEVPLCAIRSEACGKMCREQRRCTLREMQTAARLAENPRLILWIETAVLAHVLGEPVPRPDMAWLEEVKRKALNICITGDDRVLECTIGQLAHSATDARYLSPVDCYQPEGLAQHVAELAMVQLRGEAALCDGTEHKWQVEQHRIIGSTILLGEKVPSAIGLAFERLRLKLDDQKQFMEALSFLDFGSSNWPIAYFYPEL